MFRQPEKRPPRTVSTAFTILVSLPLLVLFVAVSEPKLNWMDTGLLCQFHACLLEMQISENKFALLSKAKLVVFELSCKRTCILFF